MGEVKILFKDGGRERVLRGEIVDEDAFFIRLSRKDGEVRIAKSQILKIENWSNKNSVESGENAEREK